MGGARVIAAILSLALVLVSGLTIASAQGTGDAAQLSGRLGGSLSDMQTRFGEPSWTDTGLIGYNSQTLAGVDSIVVVYYDNQNIVNKISLVYLEKPAQFADAKAIADTVAQVAPMDGNCSPLISTDSGLGSQVYPCSSTALASVITPTMLTGMGLKGDSGSYSYSVNPTDDEYFEVIVQPGVDTDTPPPTAVPTNAPEPTAVPSLTDEYPPVTDIRDLAIGRGFSEGDKLSVSGTVQTIFVDGDIAQIQISVAAPDGSAEWVIIGFKGDSSGVYEGSWITAYGVYSGTSCFTNALGGQVCQPLIISTQMDR
jgi:hypothetical protein